MNNILTMNTSSSFQLLITQNVPNHTNTTQDNSPLNSKCQSNAHLSSKYFGTKEIGVQTDLTGRQISELLDRNQDAFHQEYALYSNRHTYDSYHFENSFYQFKEKSLLGNKRRYDMDNAEIETSPQSALSQKKQSREPLDLMQSMPFTETNASDLSAKSCKQNALIKKSIKLLRKKVDAYQLFKEEFKQVHEYANEEELEKKCKAEWNALEKDVKRFYNMNAEIENKALKRFQRGSKIELKEEEQNDKAKAVVNPC